MQAAALWFKCRPVRPMTQTKAFGPFAMLAGWRRPSRAGSLELIGAPAIEERIFVVLAAGLALGTVGL